MSGLDSLVVIARYNRPTFAVLNVILIALSAYCIWIIADDTLIHPRQFSPQYSFYAIGFVIVFPLFIYQFAKLDYAVFISRRPIVWIEDIDLIYFNDAAFRAKLNDVSVAFDGGAFSRISLLAEGHRTVVLPYGLSPTRREIVRRIEASKLAQSS